MNKDWNIDWDYWDAQTEGYAKAMKKPIWRDYLQTQKILMDKVHDFFWEGEEGIVFSNIVAMRKLSSARLFEDGEDVRRSFENFSTLSRMQLIEEKNLIEVTAKDIGSGIAQVLPIIVATVGWEGMLLAVEQPELHVHPAIQQKIADMLIPYTHHNRFILLETHSEHIMLRLLRRIEETTENELPVPEYALKPDDVSVVYVEPTEEGVKMTQLPIDETGEFTRNWPRGFFEERAEDLL